MGFGPQWPKRPERTRAPRRPNASAARYIGLLVLGIIAAILGRCGPQIVHGSIEGRPRLIDGDSFYIGQTEVRMQGVDAPEGRQICKRDGRDWRCGEEARRTLERLTAGQSIRCEIHATDQHGRSLATCYSASGTNLNAGMVKEGFAVAFGDYRGEEAAARNARRGIWASEFERPQEWRRTNNSNR
jgi:endonuclease YncB( thermonuclease family)